MHVVSKLSVTIPKDEFGDTLKKTIKPYWGVIPGSRKTNRVSVTSGSRKWFPWRKSYFIAADLDIPLLNSSGRPFGTETRTLYLVNDRGYRLAFCDDFCDKIVFWSSWTEARQALDVVKGNLSRIRESLPPNQTLSDPWLKYLEVDVAVHDFRD